MSTERKMIVTEQKLVRLKNGTLLDKCLRCKRNWDIVKHASKGLCRGCSRIVEHFSNNEVKHIKKQESFETKSIELDIISKLPHKDLLLVEDTEKELGYPVTRLTRGSVEQIIHKCDVCGKPKSNSFQWFYQGEHLAHQGCKGSKIVQTNIEKYGVRNVFQDSTIQKQIKVTNLERYGVEYPNQSIEQKRKILSTKSPLLLEKYEFYNANKEKLIAEVEATKSTITVAEKYALNPQRLGHYLAEDFPERYEVIPNLIGVSKPESDIAQEFSSKFTIRKNDRQLIEPKEVDVYFPEQKVAVEYCGLYWHSDSNRRIHSAYHYEKMKACESKGVRLVTIFEDEWLDRKEVCISRLRNILGDANMKIGARECEIVAMSTIELREFFDKFHLQGNSNTQIAGWGLKHENIIVMAVSVGQVSRKHLETGNRRILEVKRVAVLPNFIVVGGFSRLLVKMKEYAEKNEFTEIRSYCDRRWGTGKVYEQTGFKLTNITNYTPHYVKRGKRYRNQSLALTPSEREKYPNMTEAEVRELEGYCRIYDCGHQTWILELTQSK